ncbi:MAG: hypothetical protein PGN37_01135 [Mycobacterium kyogaense]|uniref:hypothetical protein n=1 Tax=Mycobacterium kyogaense TaxID=2212479 RepID=UPI002FF70C31
MVIINKKHEAGWLGTGHYGIATHAEESVRNGARHIRDVAAGTAGEPTPKESGLAALLAVNQGMISYTPAEIAQGNFERRLAADGDAGRFIPLADVPDVIWKQLPKSIDEHDGRVGGRDTVRAGFASDGPEHPNHYADIDVSVDGETTWRERCLADPDLIAPRTWLRDLYGVLDVAPKHQGLLPFRVWQLFDGMVDFVRARDLSGFLAAAGVCAHYVGDAAQPLHGSALSNGDPSRDVYRTGRDGKAHRFDYGDGVHLAYEGTLITHNAREVIDGIAALAPTMRSAPAITTGRGAARAVLQLMHDVAAILTPIDIVNCYQTARTQYETNPETIPPHLTKTTAITTDMWKQLGGSTIEVMRRGSDVLANIWESAWVTGGGRDITVEQVSQHTITKDALQALYTDPDFMPSRRLDEIEDQLRPWRRQTLARNGDRHTQR